MTELKVPLGNGAKTSGCPACGEVFSTLANFDRHQLKNYPNGVTCLNPADTGLVQNARGVWHIPRLPGDWFDQR